jgi:hypothetical protein
MPAFKDIPDLADQISEACCSVQSRLPCSRRSKYQFHSSREC